MSATTDETRGKSHAELAFLTIAETDGIHLAIWPLVIPEDDDRLVFAIRLRALPDPGYIVLHPDTIASAFPKVPFTKKTTTRCSAILRYPRAIARTEALAFIMSPKIERICHQVTDMAGDALNIAPGQLVALLRESYQFQCLVNATDPEAATTMIVPFPENTISAHDVNGSSQFV